MSWVPPTLTVIIPVWNEAPLIRDAIACARRIADEVIVVDAHSPDGTASVAEAEGVRVVQAPKGRGPQLRAAAAVAQGDVLLFLHADARLPASARDAVLAALADEQIVGGGFYIRFLPASWFTRLLEPLNSLRRNLTQRYYGDTGIFVRRSVYESLGGHRPWPVMHDYDFSGRMERAGRCVYIRHPSIYASARRFEGREIRTRILWLSIQSLYRVGVPPRLLGLAYRDARGSPEQDSAFLALARARTEEPGR